MLAKSNSESAVYWANKIERSNEIESKMVEKWEIELPGYGKIMVGRAADGEVAARQVGNGWGWRDRPGSVNFYLGDRLRAAI